MLNAISEQPVRGKPQPRLKEMYAPVPLFIKDILKMNIYQSGQFVRCSIFGLSFCSVAFYGRAFQWGAHTLNTTGEDIRIYKVDDGTESILVHYAHDPKKFKPILNDIVQLEHDINTARNAETPLNCGNGLFLQNEKKKEILDACDVMMDQLKSKFPLRKKYFENGENVFVIGRPSTCRLGDRLIDGDGANKLHLYADQMVEDTTLDNLYETNFKLNLCRLYEEDYKN